MNKFALAILQLAQTRADVETCSHRIGEALGDCEAQQLRDNSENAADHLKDAYAMARDYDEFDEPDAYFVNHDGDVRAYLSGICLHCLKAHDAVQDRKQARKQYGIAKRRIATMGTAMLKAKEKTA